MVGKCEYEGTKTAPYQKGAAKRPKLHLLSFPNTGGIRISTYTLETFVFRLPAMSRPLGTAARRASIQLRRIVFET